VIDGDSIAEFLDVADENWSEVGLIQFFLAVGKVLGAERNPNQRRPCGNGVRWACAAGSGQDRIGVNGDCFGLRVHGSSFP
jgi:hypothetical protein